MKIRNGFVSNSSSSSFCILGIVYSEDDLLSLWNSKHPDDLCEDIWELENTNHGEICVYRGIEEYYELYVIGKHVKSLDENKTIKEEKIETANQINEMLGTSLSKKDISFHTDGGMDH
jgi:hypothetical protein